MIPEKKPDSGRFHNVFFGWWTVMATGIMAGWGSGVWSYGFSSYFKPMQQEFGWTRAQVSAAHSLDKLEGGVEGPFGGYFTDKYGPRAFNMAGERARQSGPRSCYNHVDGFFAGNLGESFPRIVFGAFPREFIQPEIAFIRVA